MSPPADIARSHIVARELADRLLDAFKKAGWRLGSKGDLDPTWWYAADRTGTWWRSRWRGSHADRSSRQCSRTPSCRHAFTHGSSTRLHSQW
jgi:hypothetical protein